MLTKMFRFGCANNVGLSVWGEELQITLPKPGVFVFHFLWIF